LKKKTLEKKIEKGHEEAGNAINYQRAPISRVMAVMQGEADPSARRGRVQVYSGAGHVLSCEAIAHGVVAGSRAILAA
jgi:hypothetical protein